MNTQDELSKKIEEQKKELEALELKQAELKAEQEKQEREQREREEATRRREEQNKFRTRFEVYAQDVVDELKKQGFKNASWSSDVGKDFPTINPYGEKNDLGYKAPRIHFDKHFTSTYGYSRRGGSMIVRLVVDLGYEYKSRFYKQAKADDSFNVEKAVKTFKEAYDIVKPQTKAAKQSEIAKNNNAARIERLTDRFGDLPYPSASYKRINGVYIGAETTSGHGSNWRSYQRSDNDLIFKIEHISEENIDKLLNFMEKEGMLKKQD